MTQAPSQDAIPPGANPEDPQEAHGRDFINQGSRFMLLDNVSKVADPLLVLLCARLYAGGDWGFFKYYESVLLLLMRLAVAGLDRGVVWIYSRRKDDEAFARVFSRAVNFTFVFGTLLALGAAAQWAGWLPSWAGLARRSGGAPGFNVACYLLALPFQAATLLFFQALINKRSLFPIILVRNIVLPLLTLGPAAVLAFTPLKPVGLALPYLLGSLTGFFLAVFFFHRAYALRSGQWAWRIWVPADMTRFSLPLASTDVFMSLAFRMDVLLLGRYGGLVAVEIYAVIIMIANTLRSIRQSFDGILLSVFSRAPEGPLSPSSRRHFSYAWWVVLTFQLPCLPFAMLFGGELLGLVSAQYAAGQSVLVLVIAFLLLNSLGTMYALLVTSSGRTWMIFVSQMAYLGASLGLNTWLVPLHGMHGAAVAMGLSSLLNGLICLGALLARNRSMILTGEYLWAGLSSLLWFVPSFALYFIGDFGLGARALAFLGGAAGFAWQGRRHWRRFNARSA